MTCEKTNHQLDRLIRLLDGMKQQVISALTLTKKYYRLSSHTKIALKVLIEKQKQLSKLNFNQNRCRRFTATEIKALLPKGSPVTTLDLHTSKVAEAAHTLIEVISTLPLAAINLSENPQLTAIAGWADALRNRHYVRCR